MPYTQPHLLNPTDDNDICLNLPCLCVDPLQVKWSEEGCVTHQKGAEHTECLCYHMTYFSVLVVRRAADTTLFLMQETDIQNRKENVFTHIYTLLYVQYQFIVKKHTLNT